MQLQALGKSVVVISPHDDDGIIGCGGLLSDLSHGNSRTCVLIMTDGSLNYRSTQEKDAIKEIRHREAESAYKLVQTKPFFLGFGDLNLKSYESWETSDGGDGAYKKVLKILRAVRPTTVFIPNPLDWHPDHQASYDIGLSMSRLATRPAAADFGKPIDLKNIFCYKVWDDLARVTDTHKPSQNAQKAKLRAMSKFASQRKVIKQLNVKPETETFQKLPSFKFGALHQ